MQARGKVFQKMVYDVIWLDNDWGLKEGRKYSIFPLSVIRTYVFVVFFFFMDGQNCNTSLAMAIGHIA